MSFDPISAALDFGSKIIDRIWPDATEAEKAKVHLAELAQNGELQRIANETELFKTEVADRQSARDREATIAASEAAPFINKIITPVLAIGVVVLTFVLFSVVLFGDGAIDAGRKDMAIYILGCLSSICGMVVSYYFGSSSSSVQKTDYMEKLLKK